MYRIVSRKLPNGELKNVQPFHITMKGLKKAVLCRDGEDYGMMVKYIAVCSHRKNVIVVIYAEVSNHCHVAVLAASYNDAYAFGAELKRIYAQWFQTKYLEKRILKDADVQALLLDNDAYVRNALAYIPRNALDNGEVVDTYKWSGYRAMFRANTSKASGIPVRKMTRRELDNAMHTREPLKDVDWTIDPDGELMPESFCDSAYLEQAFNNDPAFWLKSIGNVNVSAMQEKLEDAPRRMLPDSEFYKIVADLSQQWFNNELGVLPIEKKKRILPYLWRSRKTTVNQLARIFKMDRDEIGRCLKIPTA